MAPWSKGMLLQVESHEGAFELSFSVINLTGV